MNMNRKTQIVTLLLAALMLDFGSAAASDGVAPAKAAADDARARMIKFFRAKGYKEKFRKGEIVYCRKEAPLGSRFEQSVCLTEEQMAEKLKAEEALRDEMRSKERMKCVGGECVGG